MNMRRSKIMPSSSFVSTIYTPGYVVEGFTRLLKAASSLFRRQLLILKSVVVPKFVICAISRDVFSSSLRRRMASLRRFTIFKPVFNAILWSGDCFWVVFGMLASTNKVQSVRTVISQKGVATQIVPVCIFSTSTTYFGFPRTNLQSLCASMHLLSFSFTCSLVWGKREQKNDWGIG